jgi:isoleucyl-tRNA synthetase
MYVLCDGLARLIAPILPVTADDLWRHMPGQRSASIHLEEFPKVDHLLAPDVVAVWDRLMQVRDVVNGALEEQRKQKVIGNSLGASVALTATGPIAALLEQNRSHLPMLFIVSDLTLNLGDPTGVDDVRVDVGKARGVKCGRCWRYVATVRSEPDWAGICDRCVEALAEPVNS